MDDEKEAQNGEHDMMQPPPDDVIYVARIPGIALDFDHGSSSRSRDEAIRLLVKIVRSLRKGRFPKDQPIEVHRYEWRANAMTVHQYDPHLHEA